MMLSRIGHLTAAGVLLSLAVVPVAGSSQQSPPRGWWRTESIVKELGLTAEQIGAIERHF